MGILTLLVGGAGVMVVAGFANLAMLPEFSEEQRAVIEARKKVEYLAEIATKYPNKRNIVWANEACDRLETLTSELSPYQLEQIVDQ